MQAGVPSRTAYRVALRRAAHQLADKPLVFRDPLALAILGLHADGLGRPGSDLRAPQRPSSKSLRAFLVARSCFAEDALQAAALGASTRGAFSAPLQYVLLGAGLDTFAYRNPYPLVRVFEVDHPETQLWKLSLLCAAGIEVPSGTRHVATDFQHNTLLRRLVEAGFQPDEMAVFAWLGVVPYLSGDAFASTLRALSACVAGSRLVMDYALPKQALLPQEQLAFDSLASRVAAAGEPFRTFFMPAELHATLAAHGWLVDEDLDRDGINARYFSGRTDDLRCLGGGGHFLSASLHHRSGASTAKEQASPDAARLA